MYISKLFRALRKTATAKAKFDAPLRPAQPLFVVGDIHGRYDLLQQLLERIDAEIESRQFRDSKLIFVGDYIDRGENSFKTLKLLADMGEKLPENVTCLMGNHEKMMLDFLDKPEERGARWLRNGGLQTLASFGIGGISEGASHERLIEVSNELSRKLPKNIDDWLRSLPLILRNGNICITHAGADPSIAISAQGSRTLLWGHHDFASAIRDDGIWVVHGHTIVEKASANQGRISVDTGAVFTGRLTAAVISPDDVRFLEAN
jgi:calcineurin-like phosphoesterase family protein